MQIFIKCLILELDTFDCIKGSMSALKKILNRDATSKDLLKHIYIGFILQKVRGKISYEACSRKRTVKEHILKAIL